LSNLLRATGIKLKAQSNVEAWGQFNVGRQLFKTKGLELYDRNMARLLENIVSRANVVCEYGCGDGVWLKFLAEKFREKKFVGLEWNKNLAAYARKRVKKLGNVKIFRRDASKIAVRCDCFFAFGVIEHFSDTPAVLGKWVEHLTPGGFTVITVPNLLNWERAVKRHGLKLDDIKDKDLVATGTYGFELLMSPNTFLKVLINAGLEVMFFRLLEELPAEKSLLAVAGKRVRT